ncbi:MAG: Imm32 family immunity protein [Nitrospira sp.]|nr:Imm32 family immunity protein [Nitrospira sp.]
MLTVEIRDAEKTASGMAEVEIFCDANGLAMLSRQLEHLQKGVTHVHLMTPAWAGQELGEATFGEGTQLIHHLKITKLPT